MTADPLVQVYSRHGCEVWVRESAIPCTCTTTGHCRACEPQRDAHHPQFSGRPVSGSANQPTPRDGVSAVATRTRPVGGAAGRPESPSREETQ